MNWELLAFMVLSAAAIWGAFRVVTCKLITHGAVYLALVFVAVAGVFLLLDADFLAMAQVLIYVGAIITMVIFAIMLSEVREIKDEGEHKPIGKRVIAALLAPRWSAWPLIVAGAFAVVLIWIYMDTGWPVKPISDGVLKSGVTVTQSIAEQLFTSYVLPFELASVVLLVAMVGAIILTMKGEGK